VVLDRNTTALTRLVEDVLDVSRFMAGKVRLDLRPVQVATIVEQAIASTRPAAEAKGVQLESAIAHSIPPVSGDADRLQQITWNLLSNAVKFTSRGGLVSVTVRASSDHVELAVSDSGCGIAPEFLPHVFERFRQGDARFAREHGGLGLGLAITRDLVQLHGGTIQAHSDGPGRGSRFTLRIPLVANGDIDSPRKARDVLAATGADAVMIGRAAMGRPWIFGEVAHFLACGEDAAPPAVRDVRGWLVGHLHDHYALYGESTGVRSARKHIGWAVRGLPGGDEFRARMNAIETCEAQLRALADWFDRLAATHSRLPVPQAANDPLLPVTG